MSVKKLEHECKLTIIFVFFVCQLSSWNDNQPFFLFFFCGILLSFLHQALSFLSHKYHICFPLSDRITCFISDKVEYLIGIEFVGVLALIINRSCKREQEHSHFAVNKAIFTLPVLKQFHQRSESLESFYGFGMPGIHYNICNIWHFGKEVLKDKIFIYFRNVTPTFFCWTSIQMETNLKQLK